MQADLDRVLFDEATIHRRLDELAARISHDYKDLELTVIAILNGSVILMADLLRRIPLPLKLDCLSVASYHGGVKSAGELVFRQVSLPDVARRNFKERRFVTADSKRRAVSNRPSLVFSFAQIA
jgi:hypoxanthine phosphoribosyltransferase